ncbi:hypothetical protein [Oscillibacter sp.]|uniref:hypothetical protein n=1 Tax=Oscillibacter sp. TaxID=1945593 RepID=UPI0028A14903|nr:hypothetical protein [Oscillibacter sp.]
MPFICFLILFWVYVIILRFYLQVTKSQKFDFGAFLELFALSYFRALKSIYAVCEAITSPLILSLSRLFTAKAPGIRLFLCNVTPPQLTITAWACPKAGQAWTQAFSKKEAAGQKTGRREVARAMECAEIVIV